MSGAARTPRTDLVLGSLREIAVVTLVAGLVGTYAAMLITASTAIVAASPHLISRGASQDSRAAIAAVLGVVSTVFVLIALYVATIMISTATDTVIASRIRQIALLRLLGATARTLRISIVRSTAAAGALGAVIGALIGLALAHIARVAMVAGGLLPDVAYPHVSGFLVAAVGAVCVASAIAGWLGSRRVLQVSPAQSLSAHIALPGGVSQGHGTSVVRAVLAAAAIGSGFALMLVGAFVLGERPQGGSVAGVFGFVVTFIGAAMSGTGVLVGARVVIPRTVALLSRLVGRSPSSVIARRNAVHDPLRTTRSTMGIVLGVALVTTFASGGAALSKAIGQWDLAPRERAIAEHFLAITTSTLIGVIVISSVIAAVGFVSTMSLTVLQRHREIGLLRALGFTRRDVRSMITKESVALSISAVTLGIVLGVAYGSLGAQSLIGYDTHGFAWGVPGGWLLAIAAAAVALVFAASHGPARRATAVAPVAALHSD